MTSADELPDEPGTAAVPSFDALMWPTLQALKAMGGSGTNEELLARERLNKGLGQREME